MIEAKVYRASNQAITTGVVTAISFSNEYWDSDNIWVIGSPTRLTINTFGTYLVYSWVPWQDTGTVGPRIVRFLLNGTTVIAQDSEEITEGGAGVWGNRIDTNCIYRLNANDYIELEVYQTSTASLNVLSGVNFGVSRLDKDGT